MHDQWSGVGWTGKQVRFSSGGSRRAEKRSATGSGRCSGSNPFDDLRRVDAALRLVLDPLTTTEWPATQAFPPLPRRCPAS
jgi:hypothetical protein